MQINKQVVISALVLMGVGAYHIVVQKQGGLLSRVLIGGYLLALLASIAEFFGGPVAQVTGMLLALAVGTALLTIVGDIFARVAGWHGDDEQGTAPGERSATA